MMAREPVKQEPWYYQIDSTRITRKKSMQLSVSDISIMYDEQYFICDDCGEYLGDEMAGIIMNEDRKMHIIHIINDKVSRVCEKCYQRDKKEGRIIAETTDRSKKE